MQNIKIELQRGEYTDVPCFVDWLERKQKEGHLKMNLKVYEKKSGEYLSDYISEIDIEEWNSESPVFISAQTGIGKNYFIQQTLIKNLIENNFKQKMNDKILILSNRIALNRQWKREVINYLSALTGEKFDVDSYTDEGMDRHLKKFGNIYLYSYKQFLSADVLKVNFKYIVCDECHYFTSDSTIEPQTNEILDKIINGFEVRPIRIYMSATMDVVFEPIIRTEYQLIDSNISSIEIIKKSLDDNIQLSVDDWIQIHNAAVNSNTNFRSKAGEYVGHLLSDKYYRKKLCDDNIKKCCLNVYFYYIKRDYFYISNVQYYSNDETILHKIVTDINENPSSKWVIFVPTKNIGNEWRQKIQEKNAECSCVFISSDSRKNNKEAKEEFNRIVNTETFNSKVLLATSTLDNGINIREPKIRNIVIDFFDETEFLQMLGRIRVCQENEINLFIRKYSIEDLKEKLRKTVKKLLKILILDTMTKEEVDNYIEEERLSDSWSVEPLLYYRSKNDDKYHYNENAVYFLLDCAYCYMRVIRTTDPDYCVDFGKDVETCRVKAKVYNFYRYDNNANSRVWRKNIILLLKRNEEISYEDEDVYTLTFKKYFYETLIARYYQKLWNEDYIKPCFPKATPAVRREGSEYYEDFCDYIKKIEKSRNKKLKLAEQAKLLTKFVRDKNKITNIKAVAEIFDFNISWYQNLVEEKEISDTTILMMYWISKLNYTPKEINERQIILGQQEYYKNYLEPLIVETEEVEKHRHQTKDGKPSKKDYYDKAFLEKHGIKRDSEPCKNFEKIFSTSLRKGLEINIPGLSKRLKFQSYSEASDKHETYYVPHLSETIKSSDS